MARKSRKHPKLTVPVSKDTVGYIRLSVLNRDSHGSAENQKLIIEEWGKQNKIIISRFYVDGPVKIGLNQKHPTAPDQLEGTLADVLGFIITDKPVLPGMGIIHQAEGVDLLPANIELSGLEVTLVNAMSRETILREYLNSVREQYDVILLDCCPSLGMLTINALAAADEVVIPMRAHCLSIKGLEQLIHTISKAKLKINPRLDIAGILITIADMRTNCSREIVELLRNAYGSGARI